MAKGTLIFVSGLTGAGKTTLISHALNAIKSLKALRTYTTRPMRVGEARSHEYIFVSNAEFDVIKAKSRVWDETHYNGYRYGTDAAKIIGDLRQGISIIVAVAPRMEDIQAMARIYQTRPITIWINTDPIVAAARIATDTVRAQRSEDESIKHEFDHIFEPVGQLDADAVRFAELVRSVV